MALEGLIIALSGRFETSQSQIQQSIIDAGGVFSSTVKQSCTHLVASEADIEKGSNKVKQANAISDIRIVPYAWLTESISAGNALDEGSYSAYPTSSPVIPAPAPTAAKRKPSLNGTGRGGANAPEPAAKKAKTLPKVQSTLNVPLDDGVSERFGVGCKVLVEDGVAWDALLNQTDSANNNNKFYRIQLLECDGHRYQTWTRWGRVGAFGDTKILGDGSLEVAYADFNKKFKDKSGLKWEDREAAPKPKKYTYLSRKYEDNPDTEDGEVKPDGGPSKRKHHPKAPPVAESKLQKSIQSLMELIFNRVFFAQAMAEMSYDADRLPLKDLSMRVLKRAFETLKNLADLFNNPQLAQVRHGTTQADAMLALSNSYFSTIPHNFGFSRAPVISNEQLLMKEVNLLESLMNMEIASKIMHEGDGSTTMNALDRHFQGLQLSEMTPLAAQSREFLNIQQYLMVSQGATHCVAYQIQDIFRIKRSAEEGTDSSSPFATLAVNGQSDRRLLWHGSRCTNYGGILSQGLRIAPPEAPANGYAFGKGVYLADISSKSANYCYHTDSANTGLLLLCEAELGTQKLEVLNGFEHDDYPALVQAKGCTSTWGKGETRPAAWKDASCVSEELEGVKMPDMAQGFAGKAGEGYRLLYNEYIVYDVRQVKLRYLLRVKMS